MAATALTTVAASSPSGTYVHWSVFNISVTNIVIICLMVVVFFLAILLPFPRPRDGERDGTER